MRYPDFAHAQSGGRTWTHVRTHTSVRTYMHSRVPRECMYVRWEVRRLLSVAGVMATGSVGTVPV